MKYLILTKSKKTVVDDNDYNLVSNFKWHYGSHGYARRHYRINGKEFFQFLHHLILKPKKNFFIDHINGNSLDNRRCNLRLVTPSQNLCNSKFSRRNTSGHRGVTWHKEGKSWQAQIGINKKYIFLGLFKNKKDAISSYKKASLKYHGKYAR